MCECRRAPGARPYGQTSGGTVREPRTLQAAATARSRRQVGKLRAAQFRRESVAPEATSGDG